MPRIPFAIAAVLSLAFTPLAAQEIIVTPLDEQELVVAPVFPQDAECLGFLAFDRGLGQNFWARVSVATASNCLNSVSNFDVKDENGSTPLHYAALNFENPNILSLLLDAGANINAMNDIGSTPLHWAAQTDNSEIITILLDAGAT